MLLASARRLPSRALTRGLATAPKRNAAVATDLCESTGVLSITFDDEKKLNAWTMRMMEGMLGALTDAAARPEVKGVVMTGR